MTRVIRGMTGLLLVATVAACNNDPGVDLSGDPTQIQATPQVMFINDGATEQLLLRLTDDANFSVPAAPYTISNVGAGLTVTFDDTYRPDYTTGELTPREFQSQHRYTVRANLPTGGETSFTVANGGISQVITVRVLPSNLGPALSNAAPAIGDAVTITAPSSLSFSTGPDNASSVSVGGVDAVITDVSAKSITFIPVPGSSGPAEVTNVTLDYAPTLAPRTLQATQELTVPAVTGIPATLSPAAPALFQTTTVTATGFKFLPDLIVSVGGLAAQVVSISADSSSAVIRLPAGVSGVPLYSNVVLSFLTGVPLVDVPGPASITTPATPWAGGTNDATAPTITFSGAPVTFYDTWTGQGADCCGFGGQNKWYRLDITSGGSRTVTLDWAADAEGTFADMDVGIVDFPVTAFLFTRLTANRPESGSVTLAPGSYWIIVANFGDEHDPGVFSINIQ